MGKIDDVMRDAIAVATHDWKPARAHATLALIGWSDQVHMTLAEAGRTSGTSRETARRLREGLISTLRENGMVHAAARSLDAFLSAEVGRSKAVNVETLAHAAVVEGVFSDGRCLVPVMRVLASSRFTLCAQTDGIVVSRTSEARDRDALFASVADGRPYDIAYFVADVGPPPLQALEELVQGGQLRRLSRDWLALSTDLSQDCTAIRSLRRILSMTGPLPWADLLVAWSRARGQPPYKPLPADPDVLNAWVDGVEGLRVRPSSAECVGNVVENSGFIDLDRTSTFLLKQLSVACGSVTRGALFDAGEHEGLKKATLAASLSYHPAINSPSRGTWALRRSPEWADGSTRRADVSAPATEQAIVVSSIGPPRRRLLPTTFSWSEAGELVLTASVPAGPSPVIAVPKAIADILEDRQITLTTSMSDARATLAVHNSKAWGFGPLLTGGGLKSGDRFQMTFDLVAGTAELSTETGKETA